MVRSASDLVTRASSFRSRWRTGELVGAGTVTSGLRRYVGLGAGV